MLAKKLNIGFLKRKVIEDYFYSTTLVVLQSSFQVMCVKKLWGKVVVLWKENNFFVSEGNQERVDQISHYLAEKFEKNQIMGSEISITWYPGTVIYKSLIYPKTNIDIVIKSVNLALIELFQLNYRQLCFSYQLTEKEVSIDALVIATENTSISLLDKLELQDPFRITRISSLVSSVIKLYQYSEFYTPKDPAIIILEIENQLQIFLVRGNQLLNQHEEPSCFLDFNQGFETFEWAIFLKGKFKSLFFHSLGQEFPQKVDVKNVFYLTSQKFMMSASLEISKQFDLSQRSLTLKSDLVKDKKVFKTPIDLLQFGLSMQSFTSVVGESNFVRPGDFQFAYPRIHKVYLKHLFVLVFILLLLLNIWFFSREFQFENHIKTLNKSVLKENSRVEQIEKEYERILYVKDRLKRVQVILNSKIHPTYWYAMVSKYLQKDTFLKEIKVSSNRVDISGESTTQSEITQLLKGLSNEKEVSGIQLDQIVKNDNGNFSFHLGFYWNKKGK